MKFATKPIQYYPPHLRHVATLPWKQVLHVPSVSWLDADITEDVKLNAAVVQRVNNSLHSR